MRFFLIVIFLFSFNCFSQTLNLNFLFSPGLEVGGEHSFRSTVNDTAFFGISKFRTQIVYPLKTKVKAKLDWDKLKKLKFKNSVDVRARQDFITTNFSLRKPNLSLLNENQSIFTFSFGYTGVYAGLKNGIWAYSANVYFSESAKSFQTVLQPNFLGYAVRVKLNNLKFIYFYGAALVYNQKQILPVPLLGFTTKLTSKSRLTMVLPIQGSLSYNATAKTVLAINSSLSGFNAIYRDSNTRTLNYRHLKIFGSINQNINAKFTFNAEAGYSVYRNISVFDVYEQVKNIPVNSGIYFSINLKYIFGNSLLNNKIQGVD